MSQDSQSERPWSTLGSDQLTVAETLATGRVCYFSRTRKNLWRKGETSGQHQLLKEFRLDERRHLEGVPVVETMVRLHPYQSIYFNRLVGGLAGAAGRYDTDYWALSYRELVRGMVARGGKGKPRRPFRVWACEPDQVAKAYLPPGYALESRPLRARFKLATTRIGCSTRRNHDPIARVERFGVTLALAFDLSQAKAERLLGRGARRPVPRPTPPRRR